MEPVYPSLGVPDVGQYTLLHNPSMQTFSKLEPREKFTSFTNSPFRFTQRRDCNERQNTLHENWLAVEGGLKLRIEEIESERLLESQRASIRNLKGAEARHENLR